MGPTSARPSLSSWLERAELPLRALFHNKARTLVAGAGMAFAILFMFVQLGFYGAVDHTATAVSSALDCDLVLISPRYFHLVSAGSFERSRLFQVLADPAVESAVPFYVYPARWKGVGGNGFATMIAFGIDAGQRSAFALPGLERHLSELRHTRTVVVDALSQPKIGSTEIGAEPEVGDRPVQIVGRFNLGVGFLGDGAFITSDENFSLLFSGYSLDDVNLGLVKLKPGSDPDQVAERLRALIPRDTRVVTKSELQDIQRRFWVRDTAFGNIFAMGTVLGFLVGLVVLYQVLATDVTNQLPQYATLKAMGFRDVELNSFVLQQSFGFAMIGFLPGYLLSVGAYNLIWSATHLPMNMTFTRAGSVLVLCVLMCIGSGLVAARKLKRADPADLF